MSLSVCLITKNEAHNLGRCLSSVKWAEELIIVDDFSSDGTAKVAENAGAKVIVHRFETFSQQKQFALAQATGKWVLFIDADEEVSAPLQDKIREVVAKDYGPDFVGYRIKRITNFLGRWINHCGWTSYHLHLFRRGMARFDDAILHEKLVYHGKTLVLEEPILHYSYPDVETALAKLRLYPVLEARKRFAPNDKKQRRNFFYLLAIKPWNTFYRTYIKKKGYKDGPEGFMVACYNAVGEFFVQMKLWEMHKVQAQKPLSPPLQKINPP